MTGRSVRDRGAVLGRGGPGRRRPRPAGFRSIGPPRRPARRARAWAVVGGGDEPPFGVARGQPRRRTRSMRRRNFVCGGPALDDLLAGALKPLAFVGVALVRWKWCARRTRSRQTDLVEGAVRSAMFLTGLDERRGADDNRQDPGRMSLRRRYGAW